MGSPKYKDGLFIGGQWVAGARTVEVLDKYRQTPFGTVQVAGAEQVREAVRRAADVHRTGAPDAYTRSEILFRAAEAVEARRADFQRSMALEAGFPKRDADGEVTRSVETLKLAAIAAKELKGEIVPMEAAPGGQGRLGFTVRVPVGPVVAITPFNSPLNTVTHKLAPAFAAGNPVILKPSSHTPVTAAILVECLAEAGVPAGFLALLHGGGEEARLLLAEEKVRFFTFTGSTEVGRSIQAAAGLRKTQLELGSIASTILCRDADLDAALPKVVSASFRKAGQVCSSIQILLVERPILDDVLARLVRGAEALRVGDPQVPETDIGPLISRAAAERVENWVGEAVRGGAKRLTGGEREGACLRPVVLTDVSPDMRVSCEEVFGPVVTVVPFDGIDEAIERANATPYGLAAGIFTRDLGTVRKAIYGIEAGGIHINETSSSRVDLMPYGGVKASGFGQEGPQYAVREMTEERLVTLRI